MNRTYYLVCDYRERAYDSGSLNWEDHYSLTSINDLIETINLLGFDCKYFGGIGELISALEKNDYDRNGIYLNFNDGIIANSKRGQTPLLLELMDVEYSGSSPLTHLLISNKYYTNKYLENNKKDIHIPQNVLINDFNLKQIKDLKYPIIIKPNDEGSSLGITENSMCLDYQSAIKQYKLLKPFKNILAQEFIKGYEITNYFVRSRKGVFLLNELLVISKGCSPKMDNNIFTANDKLFHRRNYYNPILFLKEEEIRTIKSATEYIANEFDILTIGRIDYKYFNKNLFFIEANTIPAFSKSSEIGELCRFYNITYEEIVMKLLQSLH